MELINFVIRSLAIVSAMNAVSELSIARIDVDQQAGTKTECVSVDDSTGSGASRATCDDLGGD